MSVHHPAPRYVDDNDGDWLELGTDFDDRTQLRVYATNGDCAAVIEFDLETLREVRNALTRRIRELEKASDDADA